MLPREYIGNPGPCCISTVHGREERSIPVGVAFVPLESIQRLRSLQCFEFLFGTAIKPREPDCCGSFRTRCAFSDSDRDGHGGTYCEDVLGLACADAVALQIDDPKLVEHLTHLAPHASEPGTTKIGRGRDERHDASIGCRIEHFPECPTPEVHIVVVDILQV